MSFLNEAQATELVTDYVRTTPKQRSTQQLLDDNEVPALRGFRVDEGKCSDLIYSGPVRNSGHVNPGLAFAGSTPGRIMVRTERISTHDKARGTIPFKDQVLAQNHAYMHRLVRGLLGDSQFDIGLPDNAVVIGAENLEMIMFENVLRAYMAEANTDTSLFMHYMAGEREFAGHQLPEGWYGNCRLPSVMDTPSTKAGKDMTVSAQWLVDQGILTREEYDSIIASSTVAFQKVSDDVASRGIILVDTKTEHGRDRQGRIKAIDELYTLDSSRFWPGDKYDEQLQSYLRGEIEKISIESYSKEAARKLAKGDQPFTDEERIYVAVKYILAGQKVTGQPFVPDMRPQEERIVEGLERVVSKLM